MEQLTENSAASCGSAGLPGSDAGFDSSEATNDHRNMVRKYLKVVFDELQSRGFHHDLTKLGPYEKPVFDEFTPKLKNCTYGSDEYKGFLKSMKVALDHHYLHNRHHPEYFLLGPEYNAPVVNSPLERMNLVDLVEMLCDWMAATKRHADGNIMKSIDMNQKRFGYGDELLHILRNTAELLSGKD